MTAWHVTNATEISCSNKGPNPSWCFLTFFSPSLSRWLSLMLLSENPINSTTISLTRVNKSKYVYQIIKIDVQQTVLEGYESRVPKRGADERHGNSLRDSNRACMGNHPIIDTGFFFLPKKYHWHEVVVLQAQRRQSICKFLFSERLPPRKRGSPSYDPQENKSGGLQSCLTRTVINQTNIHINIRPATLFYPFYQPQSVSPLVGTW